MGKETKMNNSVAISVNDMYIIDSIRSLENDLRHGINMIDTEKVCLIIKEQVVSCLVPSINSETSSYLLVNNLKSLCSYVIHHYPHPAIMATLGGMFETLEPTELSYKNHLNVLQHILLELANIREPYPEYLLEAFLQSLGTIMHNWGRHVDKEEICHILGHIIMVLKYCLGWPFRNKAIVADYLMKIWCKSIHSNRKKRSWMISVLKLFKEASSEITSAMLAIDNHPSKISKLFNAAEASSPNLKWTIWFGVASSFCKRFSGFWLSAMAPECVNYYEFLVRFANDYHHEKTSVSRRIRGDIERCYQQLTFAKPILYCSELHYNVDSYCGDLFCSSDHSKTESNGNSSELNCAGDCPGDENDCVEITAEPVDDDICEIVRVYSAAGRDNHIIETLENEESTNNDDHHMEMSADDIVILTDDPQNGEAIDNRNNPINNTHNAELANNRQNAESVNNQQNAELVNGQQNTELANNQQNQSDIPADSVRPNFSETVREVRVIMEKSSDYELSLLRNIVAGKGTGNNSSVTSRFASPGFNYAIDRALKRKNNAAKRGRKKKVVDQPNEPVTNTSTVTEANTVANEQLQVTENVVMPTVSKEAVDVTENVPLVKRLEKLNKDHKISMLNFKPLSKSSGKRQAVLNRKKNYRELHEGPLSKKDCILFNLDV